MIIEFFGLSATGKTTSKNKLKEEGFNITNVDDVTNFKKFIFFLKYFICNPLSTKYLFYKLNTNNIKSKEIPLFDKLKISLMRNSYLLAVLSKQQRIAKYKKIKEIIFSDESPFQSIFMILQTESDEKTIRKIIKYLPKSDLICLFEREKKERHKIYNQKDSKINFRKKFPGGHINEKYAQTWMENMEYNYKIIKKIILKKYKKENTLLKDIKLKVLGIYKIN